MHFLCPCRREKRRRASAGRAPGIGQGLHAHAVEMAAGKRPVVEALGFGSKGDPVACRVENPKPVLGVDHDVLNGNQTVGLAGLVELVYRAGNTGVVEPPVSH